MWIEEVTQDPKELSTREVCNLCCDYHLDAIKDCVEMPGEKLTLRLYFHPNIQLSHNTRYVIITYRNGDNNMNKPIYRPCPACRGYELERQTCSVCKTRGVVDVKQINREKAKC